LKDAANEIPSTELSHVSNFLPAQIPRGPNRSKFKSLLPSSDKNGVLQKIIQMNFTYRGAIFIPFQVFKDLLNC
jgi:hypothetical protein